MLEPHRWAIELLVDILLCSCARPKSSSPRSVRTCPVFPTAGHLASWAGLCPGNHSSAGKSTKGGPDQVRRGYKRHLSFVLGRGLRGLSAAPLDRTSLCFIVFRLGAWANDRLAR